MHTAKFLDSRLRGNDGVDWADIRGQKSVEPRTNDLLRFVGAIFDRPLESCAGERSSPLPDQRTEDRRQLDSLA
jgi:hypothetical protein